MNKIKQNTDNKSIKRKDELIKNKKMKGMV